MDQARADALRWRWDGQAWIAPSGSSERHDLAIMPGRDAVAADAWSDDPPPSGPVDELLRFNARAADLKSAAAQAVCSARTARLGWKPGPPADRWTLLEMRLDADGAVWLWLHEYETDEYSAWLVRLGGEGQPVEVRRIPAIALSVAPGDAGVVV